MVTATKTTTKNPKGNIYMNIDGISGESTSNGFEGQIEILGWSW